MRSGRARTGMRGARGWGVRRRTATSRGTVLFVNYFNTHTHNTHPHSLTRLIIFFQKLCCSTVKTAKLLRSPRGLKSHAGRGDGGQRGGGRGP